MKVVVYSVQSGHSEELGNNEVVVYSEPDESVVTITTPESVSVVPSELVVVKVVVYSVQSGQPDVSMTEVVVYSEPEESVVTITTPVSVVG